MFGFTGVFGLLVCWNWRQPVVTIGIAGFSRTKNQGLRRLAARERTNSVCPDGSANPGTSYGNDDGSSLRWTVTKECSLTCSREAEQGRDYASTASSKKNQTNQKTRLTVIHSCPFLLCLLLIRRLYLPPSPSSTTVPRFPPLATLPGSVLDKARHPACC